jgi:glycine cleavage system aminomethyltransferase T
MAANQLSLRSPLHDFHVANGAFLAERDGLQFPAVYSTKEREIAAARSSVGLADISTLPKVSLRGPQIPDFARELLGECGALKRLGVAEVPGSLLLACRLADDHLLLSASATAAGALNPYLLKVEQRHDIVHQDCTCALSGFCLVGPRIEEVLRRLTPLNVAPLILPEGGCAETSLAGVPALLVRFSGRSLPWTHFYIAWDVAEYVWHELLGAGRDTGISLLGWDAVQALIQDQRLRDTKAKEGPPPQSSLKPSTWT